MQLNRRAFIGGSVVASAGLAGCTGLIGQSSDDSNETETSEYVERGYLDETLLMKEDEMRGVEWTWDESWTLEYEFIVREGPAVDVFIAEQREYTHYQEGERFETVSEVLDATSGSDSVTLESGSYAFVVDNTNMLEAEPPTNLDDDDVKVEVEGTLREPET